MMSLQKHHLIIQTQKEEQTITTKTNSGLILKNSPKAIQILLRVRIYDGTKKHFYRCAFIPDTLLRVPKQIPNVSFFDYMQQFDLILNEQK